MSTSLMVKFKLIFEEFTVEYVIGKSNVVADGLSRIQLSFNTEMSYSSTSTRARAKEIDNHHTFVNSVDNMRDDHSGIVELFKKPKHAIEFKTITPEKFTQLLTKK